MNRRSIVAGDREWHPIPGGAKFIQRSHLGFCSYHFTVFEYFDNMSPKKAPPSFPRRQLEQTPGTLRGHPLPASPREPIALQWGQDSIKLNVHRPNGDLIVEETVKVSEYIGGFLADLDDRGLVPVGPWVSIDQDEENDDPTTTYAVRTSGETWIAEPYTYVNELVWNGIKLTANHHFEY